MLRKITVLLFGLLLLGLADQASAGVGFSISVGSDDFYLSVGNYDYYQYSLPYYQQPQRVSFYDVMSDYGTWVWVQPFGQVWRPYVRSDWRPYVYGHWTYTRYGPTWVGYEPWAWAGYHYGNWIWNSRYGWVWIPGYDWHPGHVIWSHGYDAIGWMPAPPQGYDYSRGYLDYRGSQNQFDYYDNDFDDYDGDYGDPYSDSGYRDLYYRPEYQNIVINLWVFIDTNHYGYDNYSDYYLDSDYTHTLFDRRLVRISSRPLERPVLERIVKQRIREAEVDVREVDTNKKRIRIVTPVGEEENVRKNATRVVNTVIAPAFAEKQREFKGLHSQNTNNVNKVFKQENRQPRIKKLSADEVIHESEVQKEQIQVRRKNNVREKTDRVIQQDKDAEKRPKMERDHRDQENLNKKNQQRDQIQDERDSQIQDSQKNKKNRNSDVDTQRDEIKTRQKDLDNQVDDESNRNQQKKEQKQKQDRQNRDDQFQNPNNKHTQERDQQEPDQNDQQPVEKKIHKHDQQPDLNQNPNDSEDQNVAPKHKKNNDEEQVSSDDSEKDQQQVDDEKPKKKSKNSDSKKKADDSKKKKKQNDQQDEEPNR